MSDDNDPLRALDALASRISSTLDAPLLVIYYYDGEEGRMTHEDVADLYDTFRRRGWHQNVRRERLYVLLHSYGGDPDAAYRLAQVIRLFAKEVIILMPYHATSAATLLSLGSNRILLGPFATLGAIDITVGDVETGDDIELASIQYFARFVLDTRAELEKIFTQLGLQRESDIESRMMVEMIDQVTALDIGSLYRVSKLTMYYAVKLMVDYMFTDKPNKTEIANDIAFKLVNQLPSHDFALDLNMCKELRLPVSHMPERLFDETRQFIDMVETMAQRGIVCRDLAPYQGSHYKAPFLRLYQNEHGGTRRRR